MTRINVVPVTELSDQWLIAEYHELPRVIKQNIDIKDAPSNYKLGKGHVKWARKHALWVLNRFEELRAEMKFRGFKVNYNSLKLIKLPSNVKNGYMVTKEDIILNRERLIDRYKPDMTWTERHKPLYFTFNWLRRF
ncbi:MAG: hypothetical protein J6S67_22140 [Methanobrevibacter sp.]|nr:hypothetical protein [Methanobrevibacter sp.]